MSWFGLGGNTDQRGYRERDLKTQVKSGIIRLNLRKTKAAAAIQQGKTDVATLLKKGEDDKARFVAEKAIKEQNNRAAFEQLQVICEQLSSRLGVISSSRRIPLELKEAICTIIWSSVHVSIKEMSQMRQQFALKFGANLDHESLCNVDNCVNPTIISLLSGGTPKESVVDAFLKDVAVTFDIDWDFKKEEEVITNTTQDVYGEPSIDAFQQSLLGSDALDFGNHQDNNLSKPVVNDLDEFETMFAAIPETQPQNSSGLVQGAIAVTPKKVQQSIQQIKIIQRPKVQSQAPAMTPQKMSKELAEMEGKELEKEFEQLFNCSYQDDEEKAPAAPSSINLTKKAAVTSPVSSISLKKRKIEPIQMVEDNMISNVAPEGPSDYDNLFARLSSVTESVEDSAPVEPAEGIIVVDNVSEAEWEARFASPFTFQPTPATSTPPPTPAQTPAQTPAFDDSLASMDDEEIMRRFNAL